MKYISFVLRSILIVTLFPWIISGVGGSEKTDPAEEALKAIEDCMKWSPVPWPDEWKKEYIETIRKAVESQSEASHYSERMEIFRKDFEYYWESFKKTTERSLFELHQAQIRWYIEHLMGSEFPTYQERQKLRDQYTDIWNYAANSLLKQFPFIDPNAVQNAKKDDLIICYRKIDAPLMPVYLKPMSDGQVEQIKQRWDKLRYVRVDLLRRLSGNSTTPADKSDALSSNAERDYELRF